MNGIIIIDKPEGKSSAYIDRVCKRVLKADKVGHIGTLDPFATGVLAIAINNGTKVISYINTKSKVYEFEIKFGVKTDTGDKLGQIVETCDRLPDSDDIISVLQKFQGKISQMPPIYSALKIGGVPAYKLARKGKVPELKTREVEIFDLQYIGQNNDLYKFRAEVSPGTYIRTLSEDIAIALGTVGHTVSLRRIRDGEFDISNAITLDKIDELNDNINGVLVSLEDVLDDIPVIFITYQEAENLMFGRQIQTTLSLKDGQYLAKSDDGFLGIVDVVDSIIHPKKLLRNLSRKEL